MTARRVSRFCLTLAAVMALGAIGFAVYAAAFSPLVDGLDSRPAHIAQVLGFAAFILAGVGAITGAD